MKHFIFSFGVLIEQKKLIKNKALVSGHNSSNFKYCLELWAFINTKSQRSNVLKQLIFLWFSFFNNNFL